MNNTQPIVPISLAASQGLLQQGIKYCMAAFYAGQSGMIADVSDSGTVLGTWYVHLSWRRGVQNLEAQDCAGVQCGATQTIASKHQLDWYQTSYVICLQDRGRMSVFNT